MWFYCFDHCDWFVTLSYELNEDKQLENESSINFFILDRVFPLLFYNSERPLFLRVYRHNKPLGMLGEHSKSMKITRLKFLVLSQHTAWLIKHH